MSAVRVVVIAGPSTGAAAELVPGAHLLIGSAPDADLVLADAAVAPHHAEVVYELAGPRLRGLDGGCRLDGRPLSGSTRLRGEAHLELGASRLRITVGRVELLPTLPGVQLVARLGSGAAGTVYEGIRGGERVAVKVLAPEADAVEARRLVREAELSARLRHPALPVIHGVSRTASGSPALIRELIEGESLAARVARHGPLAWQDVVALGAALADALAHAHAQGVIHRDVKPQNVILGEQGPRLIDLGLGRALGAGELTRLTASREGLGTLLYMAPEQLADAHRVDGRADVYGLGLTLYHALRGEPPFMEVEPEAFLDALRARGPAPLPDAVPPALRAVLRQAYALSAESRPLATELARALGRLHRLAD